MKIEVTKAMEIFDRDIIEHCRSKTNWFDPYNPVSREDMYDLLTKILPGEQAMIVLSALGLVGVQFDDSVIKLSPEVESIVFGNTISPEVRVDPDPIDVTTYVNTEGMVEDDITNRFGEFGMLDS